MVAASLMKALWASALLVLLSAPSATADLVKDDIEDVRDILWEAQYNATLMQELEPLFGFEDARKEGPQKVNPNPLAFKNLFKRAACTFYRSGDPRTCVTTGDICCTDPNAAQDGWCCPNTDGCGANTGTIGKCTYRISWTTTTMWYTSARTFYDTTTSTIGSTGVTTLTYTSYTYVSSSMATATEWVTVTSTSAQAGKRAEPTGLTTDFTPTHSGALPSSTLSMPTATPAVAEKHGHEQEPLKSKVTDAPQYIQIRGLLIPRQTLRTDTSSRTVFSTTYFTTTIPTTVYRTADGFSTDWVTSVSTRTLALGAKTTVTSTTTLYLRPGETAPSTPQNSSGGSTTTTKKKSKGLSVGGRAGIGVGVALAFAAISAIVGFFIKKNKAKNNAGAPGADVGQVPEYKPPIQSPVGPPGSMGTMGSMTPSHMSDPRYSTMTQTPPMQYGTPSPGPMYNYPPQGMAGAPPMPMGSPPPQQYPQQMGASPPPQGMMPVPMGSPSPQQYPGQPQYQYPRPPSPTLNNVGSSPVGMQQPVPMQPGLQAGQVPPSEMPAVYSPQPQRPR